MLRTSQSSTRNEDPLCLLLITGYRFSLFPDILYPLFYIIAVEQQSTILTTHIIFIGTGSTVNAFLVAFGIVINAGG